MIKIPRAFEGKPSAPDALRLSALLVIISTGWGAFFVSHVLQGMWRVAAVDLIATVVTLVVRAAALRTGEPEWVPRGGHLAIVVSVAAIVAVAMLSGQDAAMATWYLTAVPLFAAYHMGTRAAAGWAIAVSVVIAGVHFSPLVVQFEPDYIPDENTWLLGKFVLLGTLFGLSVATRRAMDAYVRALNEREGIIRQRATELAEARDEALEAVQAKNQFLANMSHEIRTPLNGIIGMTSVLLDAEQPADQREMIETIQSSSTTLLGIINEILNFSKLQADAVEVERVPFDVFDCVDDVLDMFGGTAWQKNIDLYFLPERGVSQWIDGDVTHVRQVLTNLVANAVKFTESGAVWVELALQGDELRFSVHDTGIGIPEEKRHLLFQSFSQVDPSTTRDYGGTGLGLAISSRLVDLMGGQIRVESSPGEGSSFHFTIPYEEVPPPGHAMTTHDRIALFGRDAVIVGGPEGTRRAVTRAMESWGVSAHMVAGADGMRDAMDAGVDLIAVIDEVGLIPTLPDDRPPVLTIVPLAAARLKERAESLDVEAVVYRPIHRRTLRQAIEAAVMGPSDHKKHYTSLDPTLGEHFPASILVGEDNPVNQKVAATLLEKLGYAPDLAGSGEEVLDALDEEAYDIVFLDVHMPGMDGLQTARTVRREFAGDRQPWIVALTASVSREQRQVTRDAGMDDFVAKPFDVQALMVAIERWAQRQGMTGDADAAAGPSMWEQLNEMLQNAPERLAGLIEDHLENGAALVDEVARHLEEGATGELKRSAHSLKSSSAQFGSYRVSELAGRVEALAEDGGLDEAEPVVAELRVAWEEAVGRLSGEVERLREGAASEVT